VSELLLVVAGGALLALVAVDVVATTLTIGTSAGPFTRRVLGPAWRLLLRLHAGRRDRRLLSIAGVLLLGGTVVFWVAATWLGWSLVFLGGHGSVVSAATHEPAGVVDTVYFVGFTISTLGVGDFLAGGPGWRVLSTVASFTGLVLVTLAITYLLAVVSAVVSRRRVAVHVSALGQSAAAIVTGGWSGGRFGPSFTAHLVGLTSEVAGLAEQHLAYPVLHCFAGRQPVSAAPLALAALDDAVLLLRAGVRQGSRPDPSAVEPLRRALGRYLTAVDRTSAVRRGIGVPPLPDLAVLAAAGIPVVDDAEFAARAAAEADRRRALYALVAADGWSSPGR
jgi:hypothetical protein